MGETKKEHDGRVNRLSERVRAYRCHNDLTSFRRNAKAASGEHSLGDLTEELHRWTEEQKHKAGLT